MDYNFQDIEKRWQEAWRQQRTYHVEIDPQKPKFYVLNMFPYPSGAGLHVGHPLGYIASDIYARYKRQCGFNVLNPMGYDAYGLPAEQYAIQTGQHPAKTTEENIARYRSQLDRIGFSFDWEREVRTCEPSYYHWTQWAFRRMFLSFYDTEQQTARPIEELVRHLEAHGTEGVHAATSSDFSCTAAEWNAMGEDAQQAALMNYRIAYLGETMVNWCPALGTVLANDEVVDGVSERGGYPVVQKKMRQWCLRVSAYAQRLLDGLDKIDWTDSIKETQRNWIGRSEGTEMAFRVKDSDETFTIFTTRADTVFGVTFMVLAPESPLVGMLTAPGQKAAVQEYVDATKRRTERERIASTEKTGVFTGRFAVNPFTGEDIPIYVSDYVLAGYGTGAIMGVPAHDSRDYAFARAFSLPILPLIEGADVSEQSYDAKEGTVMNSPRPGVESRLCLNGLSVKEAIARTKEFVTAEHLGRVKVNFRLRDAIFSRQRYWGEPFPVFYKVKSEELRVKSGRSEENTSGASQLLTLRSAGSPETDARHRENSSLFTPQVLPEECLPLCLPEVSKFLPTETGEPPLGNAALWAWDEVQRKVVDKSLIDGEHVFPLELCTMPGFAGSSAYYLRYMDPHCETALLSPEARDYWQSVDLYLGGSEHATGHLIYARFWNKFLHDIGVSAVEEPFRRLVNQGMIQGRSNFVYRIKDTNTFVSYGLRGQYDTTPLHVDVNLVENDVLDCEAFRAWRPEYAEAEFVLEDGKYVCGVEVEKMSKSKYNVVNPDRIVEKYGADTLRLYEMFLGPLSQSKPWDSNGIDGCYRFLRRAWNLFFTGEEMDVVDKEPTRAELKTLHRLIRKVTDDVEGFSFNTAVPAFMIAVGEWAGQKTKSRQVLSTFVTLLSPFAPHIAEELWHRLGCPGSVVDAPWPACDEAYLKEETATLGISFNGKTRFTLDFPVAATKDEIQEAVLAAEQTQKYIAGKQIVKVIVVPGRIVNIVTRD